LLKIMSGKLIFWIVTGYLDVQRRRQGRFAGEMCFARRGKQVDLR